MWIAEQHQQSHRAEPCGDNLVGAVVYVNNGDASHSVVTFILRSVSFLVTLHRDDRMTPLDAIVIERDIYNRPVGVALHLSDIIAEPVGASDHHKVVMRERVAGEFDVPAPVRFFVEFEVKYFH